jgi:hypothetical protein
MAVTGTMPVGMVFWFLYQPIVLAEQIGHLAAFAQAPLIVTWPTVAVRPSTRSAWLRRAAPGGWEARSARSSREGVTFHGRIHAGRVRISPAPPRARGAWLAGTVPAAVARAGTSATAGSPDRTRPMMLVRQLEVYREADTRWPVCPGRPAPGHLRRGDRRGRARGVDSVLAEGYRGTGKAELLVGSPETVIARLRFRAGLRGGHGAPHHGRPPKISPLALIGRHVMPAIAPSESRCAQPP